MKQLLKPIILIPTLAGLAVGSLLFAVGYSEDAPGMCVIGLSLAFILVMWGISRAGAIKKGLLAPILLFCFGAGGIFLSIILLLDGEFNNSPEMALIGVALGIILIAIGAVKLGKAKKGDH